MRAKSNDARNKIQNYNNNAKNPGKPWKSPGKTTGKIIEKTIEKSTEKIVEKTNEKNMKNMKNSDASHWDSTVWPLIKDRVYRTLEAAQTSVIHRPRTFEFLGYDVILDEDCVPWILEVPTGVSTFLSNFIPAPFLMLLRPSMLPHHPPPLLHPLFILILILPEQYESRPIP